ncbi:LolA-like outer membrane lipoprotein chaperone [Campylobacter sp. MIT 21-1685]|uniref:LolA-like outer membrane lipoprotein chaperone n=1 Tax=unclassified Campylobacter TaxID=2593542 RepID=UPI00224ACF12|nr:MULTISPECIES: LolA-like outer membrane lipoprotein chaperone [unclassified Campylobacter]MCX2682808.1 LolA-like outer membrane lipoprotein chaperone [Campylobacter sp. MIT 21-1684]MCX2751046.1 LolA-like outer membrane lipoprotein chaperone [Campylobacter sp. MIT 21-1682]MCX2807289.1 LolA-like outer membrane lipoprotein chaperone [Campylobacter sp. MIT 21-1685]
MKKIVFFFTLSIQLFAFDFNTFSSDFTQTIKTKNSTLSYRGSFVLTKQKAFWSYTSPTKKEIYINQHHITIVEHDLEQVIFSTLQNIPNLNEIFKEATMIDKNKLIAHYEDKTYTIILNKEQIQSINYNDEFDNIITINLSNQKKDFPINENIFVPQFPKNYDKVY